MTSDKLAAAHDASGGVSALKDRDSAALTEDIVLSLLKSAELHPEKIEQLSKNAALMKSRKVRLGIASHPRTSRRIALRLIRELYTFDLLQFSLTATVVADLKRMADDLLVARLASITLGERIALARRSSATVAAALLADKESRVWQTALDNPRITEVAVVKTLSRPHTTAAFVERICRHAKWSVRPEIRLALLRNPHTPLARAIDFARGLRPAQLRDILHASKLPEKTKEYLQKELKNRK